MAISRSWTERQTTPFSEMAGAGGRGEVRNCLCSAKWRTGDDGQGGRDAGFLHSLCSTASLWNLDPSNGFLSTQSANSCRAPFSFLHPRCPNTDVRRVGRTGGWTEEEHETRMAMKRPACPALPCPPASLVPPSLRPNVRSSLCPNLECQNADPSTALGPSLWTRARSTTDPFHLTYAWQLVRRFSNFHTPLPTFSRLIRQMRPAMFRE